MVAKEPEESPAGHPQPGANDPDLDVDPEDRKPLFRDEAPGDHGPRPQENAQEETRPGDNAQEDTRPGEAVRAGTPPGKTSDAETPADKISDTGTSEHADGDPDATHILPRTRQISAARSDFDPSDDDDDFGDGGRGPLGRGTRSALLVAGVAAVVIVGLAIGYAVLNLGDTPRATSRGAASSTPSGSTSGTASESPDPNAVLSDAVMLTAAQAKGLDKSRTWKVARTQRGVDEDSPQPACLGADAVEGRPTPQQSVLRLLSSTGKKAPGVLHQADAYATSEEAVQAYVLTAKALGGCAMTGAYIASGHTVTGLGDQAVAQVLDVSTGGKTEFRSVVLNRTGRVVNVVDVAQPEEAVSVSAVAKALAASSSAECRPAGGSCTARPKVKDGPPPAGGDQPGFLATGDLPPVGKSTSSWAGTVPGLPDPDFTGSGCETVNWARVEAQKRVQRTYLLQDQSLTFGLDTMVLTHKSAKAAQALVTEVKDDLESCAKRKLTATVSEPAEVTSTGAAGVATTGWTATVSQKTTEGTAKYRVGIVSAGAKTVFTFLNPQQKLDLSDTEWNRVAVRAAERATQVR
jgi:hypothetical protein